MKMANFSMNVNILLILLLSTHSVFSLKCYICNSALDKDCGKSPPPERYLHVCSLETYKNLHSGKPSISSTVTESSNHGTSTVSSTLSSNPTPQTSSEQPLNRTARSMDSLSIPDILTLQPSLPKSDSDFTFCRKNVYNIPTQYNKLPNFFNNLIPKHDSVRLIRSCGWATEEDEKKGEKVPHSGCKKSRVIGGKGHSAKGVTANECICTGNKCNSGNYLGSLLAPQVMIVLTVITTQYLL